MSHVIRLNSDKMQRTESSGDLCKPTKRQKLDKENMPCPEGPVIKEPRSPFRDVTNTSPKTIPTTPPKKSPPDPMTPTTNIKMLMAVAASQEYVADDSKSVEGSIGTDSIMEDSLDGESSNFSTDCGKSAVSRKQKSLGFICDRFLALYPHYPDEKSEIFVTIDEGAVKLSVERRRMYDVVNVLESIDVMEKVGKNKYKYYGKRNILPSLKSIWQKAKESDLEQQVTKAMEPQWGYLNTEPPPSTSNSNVVNVYQSRKEKTLGVLSQKFLMLFLSLSTPCSIGLQTAALILMGKSKVEKDSVQFKTKIRRLYDVANIFTSVGLIAKDAFFSKQSFKYIGPSIDYLQNYTGNGVDKEVLDPLFPQSCMLFSGQLKHPFLTGESKELFPRTKSQDWDSETKKKHTSSSFHRRSSLQDMCAVAEYERKKLDKLESHNNTPPKIITTTPTIFKVAFYNGVLSTNSGVQTLFFTPPK